MLLWIEIFFALVIIDVLYAIYTKQIQKDNPLYSSLLASSIYIINALVVLGFVHDPWLLIPSALGAFVGTYIGVKINVGVA